MTSSKTKLTVLFGLAAVGAMSAFCGTAGDTFAFYGFKDAAPGADASTVSLVNAVDPTKHAGAVTVSAAADTDSAATFSDDAPGAYVYSSSLRDAAMICEHPQSVYLSATKANSGCGGTITLGGVATELSKHHETGYTVEFFLKRTSDDPFAGYGATLVFNAGYARIESGAQTSYNLYFPCDNATKYRFGFGGYTGGSERPYEHSTGSGTMTALEDGKWHHFAMIETTDGYLELWKDGTRIHQQTFPTDWANKVERTDEVAFQLGFGRLCGKYSCVRCTGRALGTEEFMTLRARPKSDFSADTVAFYPFDDRPAGESAVGATVENAAQPVILGGEVTLSTAADANPSAVFDADAPGRYIFDSAEYGATPVYENPASVYVTSEKTGSSASVKFADLGSEISRHHETGHTLEYFYKLVDSDFSGYSSHLTMSCGYYREGQGWGTARLLMPFAMEPQYANGRTFHFAIDSDTDSRKVNTALSYDLWDQLWHHVAIVETNGVVVTGENVTTNYGLQVWVDYKLYGTLPVDDVKTLDEAASIVLGNGVEHAKYSCLRVTRRALTSDGFLRASNDPTYVKKTIIHWSFDEFADQAFCGTVSNRVPSFAEENPGLYLPVTDRLNGDFASAGTTAAAFEAPRRRQTLLSGVENVEGCVTNVGIIRVVSKNDGTTAVCNSEPAAITVSTAKNGQVTPGDFTCEGFFRFDGAGWKANMGSYASARSMSLLMRLYYSGGSKVIWSLRLGNLASEKHDLSIQALTAGGQTVSASDSGDYFNDGKWHHVAVTHDVDAGKLCVYYDYAPAFEITDVGALKDNSAEWGYLGMGYGSTFGLNDFYGRFDEFRYSRGVLTTDEMLHLDGEPTGMMILFR